MKILIELMILECKFGQHNVLSFFLYSIYSLPIAQSLLFS